MLVVMGVSLFTVRIVLKNLGILDYGIFNVVGGISSSFVFFQSALTNATQRYLNFELGTNNRIQLGNIFNISLEIYSVISFFILILGITVGSWFVCSELNIPSDKHIDALVVLYATLLMLVTSFIGSVYEAVIIANENMKIYAYLGLFEAFVKLIIAYIIVIVPNDKLIVYALLLAFSGIAPKIYMFYFCRKKYEETKIQYFWDKKLFKELFAFSGWNIYGTGVWMFNQQGVNILLNLFFGPAVNAARGIAFQVTSVVGNFSANFFTAVKPQIIKTYASEDYNSFTNLIYFSSKFSVFLVWLICLPIFLRIKYVLSIWLHEVPEYTSDFICWVLLFLLVDTLNNPLWSAIQAVGKLKKTILYGSTFFLLAFPLSYIFLKLGFDAWIVYPVLLITRTGYLVIVFRILQQYIDIKSVRYIKEVILPITLVIISSALMMFPINACFKENFISLVAVCTISLLVSSLCIYIFGITKSQRQVVINRIKYYASKI